MGTAPRKNIFAYIGKVLIVTERIARNETVDAEHLEHRHGMSMAPPPDVRKAYGLPKSPTLFRATPALQIGKDKGIAPTLRVCCGRSQTFRTSDG
jgi:hypothetical protein